ncbi:MAG: hypothetical protein JXB49_31145 [Bacteroidales bacterium]|nr:hypothetical protein [Bacteroidales bacterium]MBN2820703.1 hypothetical protein [Bacteroidales bacterium]
MYKFFQNILRFIAFPFLVLIIIIVPYIIADPYMDFGAKKDYSWKYDFQRLGDLSTKKLLNSKNKYNSFILGSSRTVSLYACYLNKVIPNSSFFHYANWGEKIEGIKNKLELLDTLGYEISNAVIYIDADNTFLGEGKIDSDHYLITKQKRYRAIISHFKSFYKHINIDKIKILLGYKKIEGQPYWNSDPATNDPKHRCNEHVLSVYSKVDRSDSLIAIIDSLKETGILYKRPAEQTFFENQISDSEKEMVNRIKDILNKHSSNYYIVITPLYDQKKFSFDDQTILQELFGERLFDFSGINRFTNDEYNYPDMMHFQPYISKFMIDSILQPKTANNCLHEKPTENQLFSQSLIYQ